MMHICQMARGTAMSEYTAHTHICQKVLMQKVTFSANQANKHDTQAGNDRALETRICTHLYIPTS